VDTIDRKKFLQPPVLTFTLMVYHCAYSSSTFFLSQKNASEKEKANISAPLTAIDKSSNIAGSS